MIPTVPNVPELPHSPLLLEGTPVISDPFWNSRPSSTPSPSESGNDGFEPMVNSQPLVRPSLSRSASASNGSVSSSPCSDSQTAGSPSPSSRCRSNTWSQASRTTASPEPATGGCAPQAHPGTSRARGALGNRACPSQFGLARIRNAALIPREPSLHLLESPRSIQIEVALPMLAVLEQVA